MAKALLNGRPSVRSKPSTPLTNVTTGGVFLGSEREVHFQNTWVTGHLGHSVILPLQELLDGGFDDALLLV